MRVEGVTRVATVDAQVLEVLAGLDVCFRQPLLKLGNKLTTKKRRSCCGIGSRCELPDKTSS